jgi:hypothetical protein
LPSFNDGKKLTKKRRMPRKRNAAAASSSCAEVPASDETNYVTEIAGLDDEGDDEAEEFDDGPWK